MTLFDPEPTNAPVAPARGRRRTQVADLTVAPRPAAVERVRLVVAYDGTDFHGFAPQHAQRTVAGSLTKALQTKVRHEVELTCAGRTDAGVHAWGQVVSCDLAAGTDLERLHRGLNSLLAPEIVVRSVEAVRPDFDARFDAQWRAYRYTIVNRPVPDPFRSRTAWWLPTPLDLRRLRMAADVFLGEHDFAAFCRKGPTGSTTVRRVLESRWIDEGDGILRYEIQGTAFCWQMVRSIVGTLVEAGTGKRRPGDLLAVLHSGDRAQAGNLAPPEGLCLWEVGY